VSRERKDSAGYRRAMRELGYKAGIAGRPAAFADAHYQASWRRGREARVELKVGEK
jgi:hypothetical protein